MPKGRVWKQPMVRVVSWFTAPDGTEIDRLSCGHSKPRSVVREGDENVVVVAQTRRCHVCPPVPTTYGRQVLKQQQDAQAFASQAGGREG